MKLNRNLFRILLTAVCLSLSSTVVSNSTSLESLHLQQSLFGTTVYITPNGKCYHKTSKCRTLARSKTIKSIDKSSVGNRKPCKVCYN